jgi:hypothetical protein
MSFSNPAETCKGIWEGTMVIKEKVVMGVVTIHRGTEEEILLWSQSIEEKKRRGECGHNP